jgi:hypothetical protein
MHDLIDLVVDRFQKAPSEIFIGGLTHRLMDQVRFGHVHPYLPRATSGGNDTKLHYLFTLWGMLCFDFDSEAWHPRFET